jgi:hypothetical protein
MNGNNSHEESERRPMDLCPILVRKLKWNRGFHAAERCQKLRHFCSENGLTEEAQWIFKRLKKRETR